MQHTLASLLLIGGLASVAATIPQLIKLVRVKSTDEFNIFSWIVWLCYQLISVAYSLSIEAYVYTAINAMWVVFYAVMVVLILHYRKPTHSSS